MSTIVITTTAVVLTAVSVTMATTRFFFKYAKIRNMTVSNDKLRVAGGWHQYLRQVRRAAKGQVRRQCPCASCTMWRGWCTESCVTNLTPPHLGLSLQVVPSSTITLQQHNHHAPCITPLVTMAQYNHHAPCSTVTMLHALVHVSLVAVRVMWSVVRTGMSWKGYMSAKPARSRSPVAAKLETAWVARCLLRFMRCMFGLGRRSKVAETCSMVCCVASSPIPGCSCYLRV